MNNATPTIADIRSAIDDADEILLRSLAARFKGVEQLKILKEIQRLPLEDTVREDELKTKWKAHAKKLGIREELALMILDFVLAESKRIQKS